MGVYKYIRNLWKQPKKNLGDVWKKRLIKWRREPSTVRIERPTRLDKARSLGYKPKPGVILVRQRISRGGRKREEVAGGRRPKHNRRTKILDKNYRAVAEERVDKKYPNCEVMNSYYVAEDGRNYWFEVILIDKSHPQMVADDKYNWAAYTKGRASRGLTSAARKSRGLRKKGKGTEKIRPSKNAAYKRKAKKNRKIGKITKK